MAKVTKKKVAVLTSFFEVTSGFSVVSVAERVIDMLLQNEYEPIVIVDERFEEPEAPSIWREEIMDLRPILPALPEEKVAESPDVFKSLVEGTLEMLKSLEEVNVIITQDIVFLPIYRAYKEAVQQYALERPDLLWLHYIHSFPAGSRSLPCGYIIYPNDTERGLVAGAYGLHGQEWRVRVNRAGHSIDPLTVWPYDNLTRDLVTAADLMSGDFISVYPIRMDKSKQPEKIMRLLAGVKQLGYDPRLLIVDWQSSGKKFQKYKDELLKLAQQLNLAGKVNFTSRLDDRCDQGVPRQVVLELMRLSDVYIHPSRVETYSLVVHEAILCGCLAVLNHDFHPMRELYGDSAIYMDFGSDRVQRTYNPSEQFYWNEQARTLMAELQQNRTVMARIKARREWTPEAQWKSFEPLLYMSPVGAP